MPFEWAEALPKLAEIDWAVAAVIAVQQSLPVPPLPATPTAWRKQTKRQLGPVKIYAAWGDDMHDLVLPFRRFADVLNGKKLLKKSRYYYEGERFTAEWYFDASAEHQLRVSYDGGGDGWSGGLADIDAIEGPRIEDVDLSVAALRAAFPEDMKRRDEYARERGRPILR